MRMTSTLPDHGRILEAVLEGFVLAASEMIAAGIVPPYPMDTGVTYRPERRGSENWLLPNQVLEVGYGDCEDLAIWAAAGYRVTGDDPDARAVLVMTGPKKIHCVVAHGDGPLEDVAMAIAMRERGGYSVGGTLMIRDNRTNKPKDKFAGLPPAAANPNPTHIDDTLDKYMADNKIKRLVINTDTGEILPGSGVVKTPPTARQRQQFAAVASDELARGGQGNVAAAFAGLQHAADAGDVPADLSRYGQGTRTTSTRPPVVGQAVDQYGNPIYTSDGQQVYVDANGNPVDSRGMPVQLPDTADPYGDGMYPGLYGQYDPYGTYSQDPFYRGEWPGPQPDYPYGGWQAQGVPYGGWQSEGQPMLTYDDIYGDFGADDDGPGPLPPEFGPLPGQAGEEGYDDE